MERQEWLEKGRKLFGDNMFEWKFRCPNCGNVQSAEDFRPYQDKGATPEDAYFNCIGRFLDMPVGTFGEGKSPCDYTSGGLLCISPVEVSMEGKLFHVFEFAHAEA